MEIKSLREKISDLEKQQNDIQITKTNLEEELASSKIDFSAQLKEIEDQKNLEIENVRKCVEANTEDKCKKEVSFLIIILLITNYFSKFEVYTASKNKIIEDLQRINSGLQSTIDKQVIHIIL